LVFLLIVPATVWGKSVEYERVFIDGVVYHTIRVDLSDPTVKVSPLLTARYPGGDEPAGRILRRYWPSAAVTGTEFCTVSLRPIGDLVIDGRLRHFGGMGKALAITPDNHVAFLSVPYGRKLDWAGFESVIAAGPTLIHAGKVSLSPASEGFTDPHVLGKAARVGAGVTSSGKLILIATNSPIYLRTLAHALRKLGCVEALNLDGGSSAALYYRGRWVLSPKRRLVNLLAVFENVPRDRRKAAEPTGDRPLAMARWQSEQAWELVQKARKLPVGDAKVDLLVRACELDTTNASFCLELAGVLETMGDRLAAGVSYAHASKRFREKGMVTEALKAARKGEQLAPQEAEVIMELGRAARVSGYADLARETLGRGRALSLLQPLPQSKSASLESVAKAIRQVTKGPEPPHYLLAGTISGNTLSAGNLGLYVHLPPSWDWLPVSQPASAVANRRYMPWLMHFAVVGVPANAGLNFIYQEYVRNTMLITDTPVPTIFGDAVAVRFSAQAMAGEEPARYTITLAKRGSLLLIVTAAAEDRWWVQAEEEFREVLKGTAFVRPLFGLGLDLLCWPPSYCTALSSWPSPPRWSARCSAAGL